MPVLRPQKKTQQKPPPLRILRMLQQWHLVTDFSKGYRNREDITNLPPDVMVVGSQNVMTNTANRLGVVKGFVLDGPSSAVIAGISSSFDWTMNIGYERNLRSYLDPTTGNAVLQYRYVDSMGVVTWRDLIPAADGYTSANFNFADFWDFNSEKRSLLLFVNGSTNIFQWSGAITTILSVGTNTLTKSGTTSWSDEGFVNLQSPRKVVIDGVVYTYTGGETTTTLTGVTPDPALANPAIMAGDIVHQQYVVTANSALTAFPATFKNYLIANLRNQIYIGDLTNRSVYISKTNSFTDYSFTSPVRVVGEGALITLDSPPVAFVPQETDMYISAGKSFWYNTKFTLSSDLSKEDFAIVKLKTAANQGSRSQQATTKDKNDVVFLSNEPTLTTIGRVIESLATPQAGDLSYPIINDMNSYDLTDATAVYWKNFLIFSVPKAGLIRVYNQTNPKTTYWEAPITYPVGRFSIINGDLYGHSYNTPETYKLFTGYNFNGFSIPALAVFAYNNYGNRPVHKGINQTYVEGYISANGVLTMGLLKESGGCATPVTYDFDGDQKPPYVCAGGSSAPLGKVPLGNNPLGGDLAQGTGLPPKFRWIKTLAVNPYFYEMQYSFYSDSVDFQWELLAFGPQVLMSSDLSNEIKT